MNKDLTAQFLNSVPDSGELELIDCYTRKKFAAEQLYTFSVILCDNEVDRDTERFSVEALEKLAKLFVGKSGIFDHSMSGKDQTSRIYSAEVVTDSARKTSAGESYTCVKAKAYMVKTPGNADLIAEIDAGIKKEVSVGCAVAGAKCSVCGKDIKKEGCEHIKGRLYGGKICHTVLCEPTDAYEWSFVAVPAQKGAGVIKVFNAQSSAVCCDDVIKAIKTAHELSLTNAQLDAVRDYIGTLEEKAALGGEYREELMRQVVKAGALALPEMESDELTEMCCLMSVKQLQNLRDAFSLRAAVTAPFTSQLKNDGAENHRDNDNNEFKI